MYQVCCNATYLVYFATFIFVRIRKYALLLQRFLTTIHGKKANVVVAKFAIHTCKSNNSNQIIQWK